MAHFAMPTGPPGFGRRYAGPGAKRERAIRVADRARDREAELTWKFHPDWQGNGYATAVAALIKLAFADLGLRRLVAVCYADNERSWKLMERVGMRREALSVRSTLIGMARGGIPCHTPFSPPGPNPAQAPTNGAAPPREAWS